MSLININGEKIQTTHIGTHGNYVVIDPVVKDDAVTESGIIVPKNATVANARGVIIARGQDVAEKDELKIEDIVHYNTLSGSQQDFIIGEKPDGTPIVRPMLIMRAIDIILIEYKGGDERLRRVSKKHAKI